MTGAGFHAPAALQAAGITYRQLDYWARTGLVVPTLQPGAGSGTQRLYSAQDVALLVVVKRLLDVGVSLGAIRNVIGYLRDIDDLTEIILFSDGTTVYERADKISELLRGGQALFGISLAGVVEDVQRVIGAMQHRPSVFPEGSAA